MSAVEVRPLTAADAEACDAIVAGLPYHFAMDEGRRQCAAAVRRDPGLVAVEHGEVLGFLTFVPASMRPLRSPGWPSGPTGGGKASVTS